MELTLEQILILCAYNTEFEITDNEQEKYIGLFHSIDCHGNIGFIEIADGKPEQGYIVWGQSDNIKPILRPLSQITQEITHKGYNDDKPFIPIVELAKIVAPEIEWELCVAPNGWAYARQKRPYLRFEYENEINSFILTNGEDDFQFQKQLDCFNLMYSWHFFLGDQSLFEKGILIEKK